MSEETKRTTKVIEQEYQNLTFKSGALQYEIDCKNKDLAAINDALRGLAHEHVATKKAEDEAAAPEKQTQ